MDTLKLFGGLSVETAEGPLTGRAAQRHRLALLALLATSGGMGREVLVALLWPDVGPDRARRLLSDSVYRINQALGADTIYAAGDELRLRPDRLSSDVARFEALLGQGASGAAVELYRGPFLAGFYLDGVPEFERWADGERERLSRLYGGALEALAEASERAGELRRATEWWYRLAAHDPFSPRVALRLMQALDAAGERAAAIRHAGVYRALVQHEFGAEVDAEVSALAERLRSSPPAGTVHIVDAPRRSDPGAAPASAAPSSGDERASSAALFSAPSPATPSQSPAAFAPDPLPGSLEAAREQRASPPTATATPRSSHLSGRVAPFLGVAAALLVLLTVGLLWRRGQTPSAAPPSTIAVLPFTDLSPAGDQDYFSDGMTEELISTLSQVDGLRVASSRSVSAYRNSSEDVRSIGRALGVASVLEGRVRTTGDRLRITAQLVNVTDGYQLWSETYDRTTGDAFAIQEEIARSIAQTLRVRLARGAAGGAGRKAPDPRVYELYLRGRSLGLTMGYNRIAGMSEGYLDQIRFYEQAVARDPSFAEPHAAMAGALVSLGFLEYLPPDEAFPRAETAARRALALDPTLGQAHTSLGYVELYYRWDFPRAEESFRRAIESSAANRVAHQWYANMLTAAGRFPEALREIRLAQEADPLSVIAIAAEGWVNYYARDYPAALDASRRALVLNPEHALPHLWRAWALEEMDSLPSAIQAHRRAVVLSDSGAVFVAALARAYARSGDRVQTEALLRQLNAQGARGSHIPPYEIAKIHEALGERDRAFAWLERARGQRSHSMALLRVDPQLDPLRRDPRFRQLLAEVFPPRDPVGNRQRAQVP